MDYFVACREVPPARAGGWSLAAGPVKLAEVPVDAKVAGKLPDAGAVVAMVQFQSGAVARVLALELARVTRGAVISSDAVEEDFAAAPKSAMTAEQIEAALKKLADEVKVDQKQVEAQKRDYDKQKKKEDDFSGM
jgi:hypothetical protein